VAGQDVTKHQQTKHAGKAQEAEVRKRPQETVLEAPHIKPIEHYLRSWEADEDELPLEYEHDDHTSPLIKSVREFRHEQTMAMGEDGRWLLAALTDETEPAQIQKKDTLPKTERIVQRLLSDSHAPEEVDALLAQAVEQLALQRQSKEQWSTSLSKKHHIPKRQPVKSLHTSSERLHVGETGGSLDAWQIRELTLPEVPKIKKQTQAPGPWTVETAHSRPRLPSVHAPETQNHEHSTSSYSPTSGRSVNVYPNGTKQAPKKWRRFQRALSLENRCAVLSHTSSLDAVDKEVAPARISREGIGPTDVRRSSLRPIGQSVAMQWLVWNPSKRLSPLSAPVSLKGRFERLSDDDSLVPTMGATATEGWDDQADWSNDGLLVERPAKVASQDQLPLESSFLHASFVEEPLSSVKSSSVSPQKEHDAGAKLSVQTMSASYTPPSLTLEYDSFDVKDIPGEEKAMWPAHDLGADVPHTPTLGYETFHQPTQPSLESDEEGTVERLLTLAEQLSEETDVEDVVVEEEALKRGGGEKVVASSVGVRHDEVSDIYFHLGIFLERADRLLKHGNATFLHVFQDFVETFVEDRSHILQEYGLAARPDAAYEWGALDEDAVRVIEYILLAMASFLRKDREQASLLLTQGLQACPTASRLAEGIALLQRRIEES
tara:strand:- start:12804 stop:14786 length:1983 start_codon:yes stop_codon:yes gene_type:complete